MVLVAAGPADSQLPVVDVNDVCASVADCTRALRRAVLTRVAKEAKAAGFIHRAQDDAQAAEDDQRRTRDLPARLLALKASEEQDDRRAAEIRVQLGKTDAEVEWWRVKVAKEQHIRNQVDAPAKEGHLQCLLRPFACSLELLVYKLDTPITWIRAVPYQMLVALMGGLGLGLAVLTLPPQQQTAAGLDACLLLGPACSAIAAVEWQCYVQGSRGPSGVVLLLVCVGFCAIAVMPVWFGFDALHILLGAGIGTALGEMLADTLTSSLYAMVACRSLFLACGMLAGVFRSQLLVSFAVSAFGGLLCASATGFIVLTAAQDINMSWMDLVTLVLPSTPGAVRDQASVPHIGFIRAMWLLLTFPALQRLASRQEDAEASLCSWKYQSHNGNVANLLPPSRIFGVDRGLTASYISGGNGGARDGMEQNNVLDLEPHEVVQILAHMKGTLSTLREALEPLEGSLETQAAAAQNDAVEHSSVSSNTSSSRPVL